MNLKTSLHDAWKAVENKDTKLLARTLDGLNQFSTAIRFSILGSLLRGSICGKFDHGVSALLNAGAKPCVADLSLAIQERDAETVRQLLTPELLDKLAQALSAKSFEFAFQQIERPRWKDYKSAYSQIPMDRKARLAQWMASISPGKAP